MVVHIGVCGAGFVGDAVQHFFAQHFQNVTTYDKYKSIGSFSSLLHTEVLFVCLPTPLTDAGDYNTREIEQTLALLAQAQYAGEIVIKSTVGPTFLAQMDMLYPELQLLHNPEFLTARTARQDFAEARQIILGVARDRLKTAPSKTQQLYAACLPMAQVLVVDYATAALVKLGCNAFYATKVQFCTNLFLLAERLHVSYKDVRNLMLGQGWIHPMHTLVPGPDGDISFGGACLPKDTAALEYAMTEAGVPCQVLAGVLADRDETRLDKLD